MKVRPVERGACGEPPRAATLAPGKTGIRRPCRPSPPSPGDPAASEPFWPIPVSEAHTRGAAAGRGCISGCAFRQTRVLFFFLFCGFICVSESFTVTVTVTEGLSHSSGSAGASELARLGRWPPAGQSPASRPH